MEGNAKSEQWWLPRYEHFFIGALIAFLLGNVAAYALPSSLFFEWRVLGCLMLVMAGIVVASQARWVIRGGLLWVCFLAGSLWFSLAAQSADPHDVARLAPLHEAQVEGMIIDHPSGSSRRAFVDVLRVNNEPGYRGKILVTADGLKLPKVGTTVLLQGDLGLPRVPVVPGEFNERTYLRAENVTAVLRHVDVMRVVHSEPVTVKARALRFLSDTQSRMASVFTAALPSPEAEVLGGIVLGGRAIPVDKATKRQFVETGLVHILAASGMNVGIVAMFVYGVLKLFRVPMAIRLMLAMLAVAFYAVLTGMPPSIQRASTMLELALLLKLLRRELSPLFLLCIVTTALVMFDPGLVGSLGFQFSVLTTFGLITMVPPLQDWLGRYITRALAGIILVPVVAQLWVTPLTLYHFNQLPLHSVGLNILALFFVIPLTSIGFTAGALSLLWAPLGHGMAWLAWPFVKALLWVVQTGDAMHWAKASLPSPEPWLVFALYGLLAWIVMTFYACAQWPLRQKVLVAFALIAFMLIPLALRKTMWADTTQLAVIPLSYRKAAFVVYTPEPLVVMPGDASYYEGRRLVDYLRHENIRELSALVLYGETSGNPAGKQALLKQLRGNIPQVQLNANRPTTLRAGNTSVMGNTSGKLFEVRSGNFCLTGLGEGSASPRSCPMIYRQGADGYRLLPARFFEPDRYYRLSYTPDGRLTVLTGR